VLREIARGMDQQSAEFGVGRRVNSEQGLPALSRGADRCASTPSSLLEVFTLRDFVRRQPRSRLQPAAEVEERSESRDFPDRFVVPARFLQGRDVLFTQEAGRLGELAGVAEQRPGVLGQVIFGPFRCEFPAQVLIPREATNCRRMEADSRCSAHFSVHHGGQHLALHPAKRR